MLAIVITALLVIKRKIRPESISPGKKWMICASIWIMPLSTSIAAVILHSIVPVNGNWCGISAVRPEIQYALAHGWRLAIIFSIVLLHAYMCWLVHYRFRVRGDDNTSDGLLQRSKFGSISSDTSEKDVVEVKHINISHARCESSGSWLPIQSPEPSDRSVFRRSKIIKLSRRQVGQINSLYNLGPGPSLLPSLPVPPRIQTPRQDSRTEDREDWLREILNIGRSIDAAPMSLEPQQSARESSESGPVFPIQVPEVPVDEKPHDEFVSTALGTTGPNYHNECPKITKSYQVSVENAEERPANWTLRSAAVDTRPGPNYHNQCPKVTGSFEISVDGTKKTRDIQHPEATKLGPRYHSQCPKVTRTVDVSTNRVPTSSMDMGEPLGPRYHSQCPKVTRTVEVSTDEVAAPSYGELDNTGPRYHSQCPKVTRTVDVSTNEVVTPHVDTTHNSGPSYHSQCPKVIRTVDVATDRLAIPIPGNTESPGPNYHNQCPKVTRTVGVHFDRVSSPSPLQNEGSGPNYHNQCPKVSRTIEVSTAHTLCPPLPTSSGDSGSQYHQQCPKVQRSFDVTVGQTKGDIEGESAPRYHNQCPKVTRSVDVSSSQAGPNYHSECPLVKRSVMVSIDPANRPDNIADASPQYHNQCPKVKRSFTVSFAGQTVSPARQVSPTRPLLLPPPPQPALLPKTETTILTSPLAPPPSPTPGLPPPPWSPAVTSSGSKIPFKKPAIFRRSIWSDSSHSSHNLDPVTPWATTPRPTIASRIQEVTEHFRCHCSSILVSLRSVRIHGDDEDTFGVDYDSSTLSSEREMRSALLLNAYPLPYIILWLPSIVDRFMEAESAQPGNSRVMAALQACTQWIPLANAMTLGLSLYLRWRVGQGRAGSHSPAHSDERRSFWI